MMIHHHISCFPPVLRITVAEALGKRVAGDLELSDLKQIFFIYGFYWVIWNKYCWNQLFQDYIYLHIWGMQTIPIWSFLCTTYCHSHNRNDDAHVHRVQHVLLEFDTKIKIWRWRRAQSCFSVLSGVNLPYRLQIWLIRCKWVLHQARTQNTPNLWICPRIWCAERTHRKNCRRLWDPFPD